MNSVFLSALAFLLFLFGPLAFILVLIAFHKIHCLQQQFQYRGLPPQEQPPSPELSAVKPTEQPLPSSFRPSAAPKYPPMEPAAKEIPMPFPSAKPVSSPLPPISRTEKSELKAETFLPWQEPLEERIGTRWILIAGIITILFGVSFFLKYAYDHNWLAPWLRVGLIAAGAAVSLIVGELTRRQGYETAAKGTTALGFALFYAAIFAAFRLYGLIGTAPAYALAVIITAAAMTYAVILDEVLIAFLSLFGGYLTPILLSTGQNLPNPLFSYVLILGLGAMGCAFLRNWRAVSIAAFIGTYLLYTAWFEKFYVPAAVLHGTLHPHLFTAIGWLSVFFLLYLLMPLTNGLLRKTLTHPEEVWITSVNGLIGVYFLARILHPSFRTAMACGCAAISGIYFILMLLVRLRCPQDQPVQRSLLLLSLAFLTAAFPFYFQMRALTAAWAIEGTVLAGAGIFYRSRWTQAVGLAASALSIVLLFHQLPMHTGTFRLAFNPDFGIWIFVCMALLGQHLLYRLSPQQSSPAQPLISSILYCVFLTVFYLGLLLEWHAHCRWNLAEDPNGGLLFVQAIILLTALLMILLLLRPLCPNSSLCRLYAFLISSAGTIYTAASMGHLYNQAFRIFFNSGFGICCLFTAALFAGAALLKAHNRHSLETELPAALYAVAGVILFWLLLSKQIYLYWDFQNRFTGPVPHWKLKASMYISLLWAIYGAVLLGIGFWKKWAVLRYLALALLGLLLAKIFIWDLSTLKIEYRIAVYLGSGAVFIAISYLYQFAKKKNFFRMFETEAPLTSEHTK